MKKPVKIKQEKTKTEIIKRKDSYEGIVAKIHDIGFDNLWKGPYGKYELEIKTKLVIKGKNGYREIEFFGYVESAYLRKKVVYFEEETKELTWVNTGSIWRRLEREHTLIQRIVPQKSQLPPIWAKIDKPYNSRQ